MSHINKVTSILELSESRKFNNATKIQDLSVNKRASPNLWPRAWKKIYYKAYPRFKQVMLPKPKKMKANLFTILMKRESRRSFSNKRPTPSQLSNLLYYSSGMKNIFAKDGSTKRMYPSAGARYPLEVYPFIFNCERIKNGIYHYHLKTHSLELITKEPFFDQTIRQFGQSWIRKSAILIVVSAVFGRTEMKYKDRGYRHILTEYGHVAQNFYLVGKSLKLEVCSIGGFVDNGLNKLLDIDGVDESVIGVIAVGIKK